LSKSELQALFTHYDNADAEFKASQEVTIEKKKKRSEAIQAIIDHSEGKTIFNRNGRKLTAVRRGDTLYFRGAGEGKEEVEV
jgi:hypothetical protein